MQCTEVPGEKWRERKKANGALHLFISPPLGLWSEEEEEEDVERRDSGGRRKTGRWGRSGRRNLLGSATRAREARLRKTQSPKVATSGCEAGARTSSSAPPLPHLNVK